MSWQYIIFFLLAAVPAFVWILGQIIERTLERKGFTEKEESGQSFTEKLMLFITGCLGVSSMIGLSIGAFGYTLFLVIGIASIILSIIFMYKLEVFKTLFKG